MREEKGGHIRLEWNSTFPLDCFSVTNPTCWQIKPTAPKFHKQMRGSKKFKSPFSNSLTSPAKWGNIDMAFPHEPPLRAQIFSWLRRCKKPTVRVGGERRFLRQDKDTYYRTVGPTNCSRNDRSYSRLHPPLATDFCYFSAIFPLFPSASFPPGFSQIHANGSGQPSKKLEDWPVIVRDCGGSGEELRRWHRLLGLQSMLSHHGYTFWHWGASSILDFKEAFIYWVDLVDEWITWDCLDHPVHVIDSLPLNSPVVSSSSHNKLRRKK